MGAKVVLKLGGSVLDVRGMEGRSSEADPHSRICGELRRPHRQGTGECLPRRTDGEKASDAATDVGTKRSEAAQDSSACPTC
ncbi:hypothetical protein PR002_g19995 [Phytophthora rubi]|uniref:Uncharacterized protein n=1 Tax=Phytophthora rubi TaxID=129364 RepID=A0A6A3JGD3_9STRA|nr:hypothetical protein PR002_g19995 [Phytophthora rubi]